MYCYSIVIAPTLKAGIMPEAGRILDIFPFNIFHLRCVAKVPESVALLKTFQWQDNGKIINDNGNSVLISHINVSMSESISELTVSSPPVGRYTYVCTANITIPNGESLIRHASAVLTVRGKYNIWLFVLVNF